MLRVFHDGRAYLVPGFSGEEAEAAAAGLGGGWVGLEDEAAGVVGNLERI